MKRILFLLVFLLMVGGCQKDEINDLLPLESVGDLELRDASPLLISESEKASLLKLYDGLAATGSTGQLNWRNADGTVNEISAWVGVYLNANGRVYFLGLYGKGLIGDIPSDWGDLPQLQSLYLFNNQLTSIPSDWGYLPNLYYLYLFDNQITSTPPDWSGLPSLRVLFLRYNRIACYPLTWLTEVCGKIGVDDVGNPASYYVFCSSGGTQDACTPASYLEKLNGMVNELLTKGVTNANGLKAKLTEIERKIENGKIRPAIHQLKAFKHQVAAMLQGGNISSETAAELTDAVNQLIELLEETE